MARLAPGSALGSYQVLAPLGAGGMGEVYRARDPRLGRDVAIKLLPEDVAASPDRLARFEREARTVAALNHPNIVTIHSIEEADGIRFLTMELVDGDTIDRAAAARPGLAGLIEWAITLADALAAAHDRGIVHRDLKPANVMVTRDRRIKVLDFGLARVEDRGTGDGVQTVARTMDAPITGAGVAMGTVPYMAPEQIRGEAVDARADLFSLGILLYELAAGRRPFVGDSWADVSSSILRDAPAPLLAVRGDLPRDLERIVARCLEKDRERRFQTAKDVRNELELVRRAMAGPPPAPPAAPAPAGEHDLPSVAVLPFANRSASADDEYFSDGLADELLNVLARIRGLRVAARTSSNTFKGKSVPIGEVGATLRVSTVLEGSVRKSGNRVRIAVQLVKVEDGYPLWSETYDRTLDDIFAVQDDIAQSVVKELRAHLLGEAPDSDASREVKAEVAAAARGRASDPEAHRLYLQGRHLLERLNADDVARAIRYFEEAIARDPEAALPWVGMSLAGTVQGGWGFDAVDRAYPRALEAARRAIALAPDLAEAHVAMARVRVGFDFDWKEAERSLRRALELAPGKPDVLAFAGSLALYQGRFDDGIRLVQEAIRQDPLSAVGQATLAFTLRAAGRLAEAEVAFARLYEIVPTRVGSRLVYALVQFEQGRLDEALETLGKEPADWARLTGLAILLPHAGRQAEADAALAALERDHATESAYQISIVHSLRGDADRMFAWLERARANHDAGLVFVAIEPCFRPHHADPRWAAFLGALGSAPGERA